MRKERLSQRKNKRVLKEFIYASILAVISIILLNWGLTELASEKPFGVNPINHFKLGQIIGYWLILGSFCTGMFFPLYLAIRNAIHTYAKNTIFIHSVHSESMKDNRIIVTAHTNKDKIHRQYLLVSEVTDGAVIAVNLTTMRMFSAKIETTLDVTEIKKLNAPKKLTYALNKKAWEK